MFSGQLSSDATPNPLAPVVVGIAGRIAAGKTTLCSVLSGRTGWQSVNLGSYLRIMAGPQLRGDRRALQEFGARLVSHSIPEVCQGVLKHAGWSQRKGLILDGIRNAAVVSEFRRLVFPTPFLLVYVETQDPVRETRYSGRASSCGLELRETETHYMEQEPARTLPELADILVRGDIALDDEVAYVSERIYELTRAI